MLKREWGAESNGNIPHLFISSKTPTSVTVFAQTATLLPAFEEKDLPLGRTLMINNNNNNNNNVWVYTRI